MRTIFLGSTKFSEELLQVVFNHKNVDLKAVFTIPEEFSISYSDKVVKNTNFADLSVYAKKWNISHFEVNSKEGKRLKDYKDFIKKCKPDVILVLGWYYMVPKEIREIATYGAWGIHASLLPEYAGGAPLVWAMINGENKTGVTLFQLSNGVDDGDIIDQRPFSISMNETIKEVYKKATIESKKILIKAFDAPEKIEFTPQDKSKIQVYPQRKPEDGEINLSWSSERIYNFIRAQCSPYPGAFIKTKNGKKLIIEKVRIE